MVNQILKATEEWLSSELRLSELPFIWEKAEQKEIDEVHDVKRWFDYLKEKDVIPKHFRLEAFTIPRLDSFEGDDMLVVYQEGALWTGYPLTRFTAFTKHWNKRGILEFLYMLFPSIFVGQKVEKDFSDVTIDNEAEFTYLDGWGSINAGSTKAETEEQYIEETFIEKEEQIIELEEVGRYSEFNEEEFDDEDISFDSSDVEYDDSDLGDDLGGDFQDEYESVENVDAEYVSQLLEGINAKLSVSISTVEECVQEAIDLASQKKGSKKLVRMILEVEKELTDLKEQLTNPAESDEE